MAAVWARERAIKLIIVGGIKPTGGLGVEIERVARLFRATREQEIDRMCRCFLATVQHLVHLCQVLPRARQLEASSCGHPIAEPSSCPVLALVRWCPNASARTNSTFVTTFRALPPFFHHPKPQSPAPGSGSEPKAEPGVCVPAPTRQTKLISTSSGAPASRPASECGPRKRAAPKPKTNQSIWSGRLVGVTHTYLLHYRLCKGPLRIGQ